MSDPDYCDPKQPEQPTRGTDFVYLLDPVLFLEKYPELFAETFPGRVKILGGTPIITNEYILVDDEPKLRFLSQKGQFRLDVVVGELRNPLVTVEKYRYCGGKALVLISSEDDLDPLYKLPLLGYIRAVSTTDNGPSGYIKPGGQGSDGSGQDGNTNTIGRGQDGNTNTIGRGQDGNTNTIGRGQGYPNAYGLTYPGSSTEGEGILDRSTLKGTDPCLNVAVLDSGISFIPHRSAEQELSSTRPEPVSCRDAVDGWNFVEDNHNIDDTQTNRHGTRVASIIRSVCPEATIIPVRISNEKNVCTLYDALSGLEYAAQQRVQIINASWVFSTTQGIYIPLLQASLRRLSFRGILVVCAAGNIGPVMPGQLNIIPTIGQSKGNLNIPFLSPACSSEVLENVITVTSVDEIPDEREATAEEEAGGMGMKRVVCECGSKRFVTVGVLANGDDRPHQFGSFKSPAMNPFRGTSFATPYVTGHIAHILSVRDPKTHVRADVSSRKDILRAIGARRDPDLRSKIKNGMWMKAD